MYHSIRSSFYGKIEEIPGIYIDNFENADKKFARAYFLSHYHADHVQGLHSSTLLATLKKSKAIIYTTELTAAIINHEDENGELMNYVTVLKKGSTLITLPSIPEEDIPEVSVTVTLIPAGHSAGSTMFLFRTTSECVLFTGDFRMNCNDLHKYTSLHDNGTPIKLSTLYVDTTFIDLEYENFPKRSESVEKMLYEINKWLLCDPINAVAIYTPARYGYEYVFNEIYKKLGQKVYVDDYKWKFYSTVQHLVPGVTNDDSETKIHLCRKKNKFASHEDCINQKNKKYFFVYLSAMKWKDYKEGFCPVNRVTPSRMDVCFATHSSRKEIYYFVNYLSPNKIIGFPNSFIEINNKRTSVLEFKREEKKCRVDKKVDENLLRLIFG